MSVLFDGTDWSAEDQDGAQVWGWELNQFDGDGQICIVADESRDTFTGKGRNLRAHAHVVRSAGSKTMGQYRRFCRRALAIVEQTRPRP